MIVRSLFDMREDGVKLYRTYSDIGRTIIRNDGVEYDEAIDVESSQYTYIESDHEVESDQISEEP